MTTTKLSLLATAFFLLSSFASAEDSVTAPPAPVESARSERTAWVYLYPALSWLNAEQGSASQSVNYTAHTIQSGGIRGGKAFGPWSVEASAELEQFAVASQNEDGSPTTLDYRGHRLNLEVFRRAFSDYGRFRITGYGRLGIGTLTMPLILGENQAELSRASQTVLNVGFSLASYIAPRTRLTAAIRWMPSLGASASDPSGRTKLSGGFNFGLSGGAQYLFPSQWSLGLLGSLQTARASGTLAGATGAYGEGEVSSTVGSAQLHVGYQF